VEVGLRSQQNLDDLGVLEWRGGKGRGNAEALRISPDFIFRPLEKRKRKKRGAISYLQLLVGKKRGGEGKVAFARSDTSRATREARKKKRGRGGGPKVPGVSTGVPLHALLATNGDERPKKKGEGGGGGASWPPIASWRKEKKRILPKEGKRNPRELLDPENRPEFETEARRVAENEGEGLAFGRQLLYRKTASWTRPRKRVGTNANPNHSTSHDYHY